MQPASWYLCLCVCMECVGLSGMKQQCAALVGGGISKLSLFLTAATSYNPFFQTAVSSNSLLGGAGNRTRDRMRLASYPLHHEPPLNGNNDLLQRSSWVRVFLR